MVKHYKIQVSKEGQYSVTLPLAICQGKGWVHGTPVVFRFGPKGEVIIEETKTG